MTTELRKTVVRRCAQPYDHRRKKLVVALEPGDVISSREERSRRKFWVPLGRVFRQVVLWNVAAEKLNQRKGVKACEPRS